MMKLYCYIFVCLSVSLAFRYHSTDSSSFDSTPSISQSFFETTTQTVPAVKATDNAPIATIVIGQNSWSGSSKACVWEKVGNND